MTNRDYRVLEVPQAFDKPMTVDDLPAELEIATDEVHKWYEADAFARDILLIIQESTNIYESRART